MTTLQTLDVITGKIDQLTESLTLLGQRASEVLALLPVLIYIQITFDLALLRQSGLDKLTLVLVGGHDQSWELCLYIDATNNVLPEGDDLATQRNYTGFNFSLKAPW